MKFKIIDKRRILSYLQATSNEIALDILCYKVMGVNPEEGNYIPRPGKLLKYSNRGLIKFLKIFWIYLFGYFLFFFQFLVFFLGIIKVKEKQKIINNKSVGVAFSDRSIDVINAKNINVTPDYWIVFPWTDSSRLDKKSLKIEFFGLLTIRDLCKAFVLAVCAHNKMYRSPKFEKWIFQSYTSFKWFNIRIVLEKIEADFFIAEHFDRWAVMMDGILFDQYKNGLKSSLVLVQHGLVSDVGLEKISLPYKFSQFKRLYLYDKSTENYFRENILAKYSNRILKEVLYYDSLLVVSEIPITCCVNVLFVGHSICTDLHIHILKALISKYQITAYYKPHPVEKKTKLIHEQNWTVINDKHFFPTVDFLITYPSTLAKEYELIGINSVVHPIDLKVELVQSYLEELEREIASWHNKKNINTLKKI